MDTLREFTAGLHTICTTILSFWGHAKHIEEGSPDPDLTKEAQPDDEDQSMCPICTEELEGSDFVTLPCNPLHTFHTRCISQWAKVNPTCPLDRQPISPEALVGHLSAFNKTRLHISLFAENVMVGTSAYLWFCHHWHDGALYLAKTTFDGLNARFSQRLDDTLYGVQPNGSGPSFPGWSRRWVLRICSTLSRVLMWSAYSAVGSRNEEVIHFLVSCSIENYVQIFFEKLLQFGNYGYEYGLAKELVRNSQWYTLLRISGFLVGVFVVGRPVRNEIRSLSTTLLAGLPPPFSSSV